MELKPFSTTTHSIRQLCFVFQSVLWPLLSLVACQSLSYTAHLKGSSIKCYNEGEYVNVPMLYNDPCYKCKCINQEVVCNREQCLHSSNCYLLLSSKNNSCCKNCKGCWYENVYYKSGQKWTDSKDPCVQFICLSGVVTQSRSRCLVTCNNPISRPNECCPVCKGCEVNGHIYQNGDVLENNWTTDKCVKCKCIDGHIQCIKEACPVLSCPQSRIVHKSGNCCPECRGYKVEYVHKRNCIIGVSAFQNGQTFDYDKCTNCSCNGTTNICTRNVCNPLKCPLSSQVVEPGECCPVCFAAHEPKVQCTQAGNSYKSGESWKIGRCVTCTCFNGEVKCSTESCAQNLVCPHRYKAIRLPTQCCQSCVETDGECMLIGSQLYTFDEKVYNIRGKCNYVITRDCQRKTFYVHVVHDSSQSQPFSNNSIHNAVVVKVDNTKVTLTSNNTRIGRKPVDLPFIKLGVLSIVKDGNKVIVRGNIGIKVIWKQNESLQVSILPEYKNKVCGLCGNFNGNGDDDFATKNGEQTNSYQRFINSWRVGKTNQCSDFGKANRSARRTRNKCATRDKRLMAITACELLTSSLFQECRKVVRHIPYLRLCYAEMCQQQNYCNSVSSFISECRNAGVVTPTVSKIHLLRKCDKYSETNGSYKASGTECPLGAVHSVCVSACRKTCKNYRRNRTCRKSCKPGCMCPVGTVIHSNRCIRPRHCPLPITASISIPLNSTSNKNLNLKNLKTWL